MAFKRSAVRSRLSPPSPEIVRFHGFFFASTPKSAPHCLWKNGGLGSIRNYKTAINSKTIDIAFLSGILSGYYRRKNLDTGMWIAG